MFVVLVVLGLLGTALATDCGPLQKIQVKREWAHAYSEHHVDLAVAVWKHFFESHSDRSLFKNVHGDNIHSPEFTAHMVRVFAGFDILISVMDDEPVFKQALAHYSKFHKQFGKVPFEDFGHALIDVLPDFGHSNKEAWDACYAVIANGMH